MGRSDYESITFKMKLGYTQEDLAKVLRTFEGAFGNYLCVKPNEASQEDYVLSNGTWFTVYFQKKCKTA